MKDMSLENLLAEAYQALEKDSQKVEELFKRILFLANFLDSNPLRTSYEAQINGAIRISNAYLLAAKRKLQLSSYDQGCFDRYMQAAQDHLIEPLHAAMEKKEWHLHMKLLLTIYEDSLYMRQAFPQAMQSFLVNFFKQYYGAVATFCSPTYDAVRFGPLLLEFSKEQVASLLRLFQQSLQKSFLTEAQREDIAAVKLYTESVFHNEATTITRLRKYDAAIETLLKLLSNPSFAKEQVYVSCGKKCIELCEETNTLANEASVALESCKKNGEPIPPFNSALSQLIFTLQAKIHILGACLLGENLYPNFGPSSLERFGGGDAGQLFLFLYQYHADHIQKKLGIFERISSSHADLSYLTSFAKGRGFYTNKRYEEATQVFLNLLCQATEAGDAGYALLGALQALHAIAKQPVAMTKQSFAQLQKTINTAFSKEAPFSPAKIYQAFTLLSGMWSSAYDSILQAYLTPLLTSGNGISHREKSELLERYMHGEGVFSMLLLQLCESCASVPFWQKKDAPRSTLYIDYMDTVYNTIFHIQAAEKPSFFYKVIQHLNSSLKGLERYATTPKTLEKYTGASHIMWGCLLTIPEAVDVVEEELKVFVKKEQEIAPASPENSTPIPSWIKADMVFCPKGFQPYPLSPRENLIMLTEQLLKIQPNAYFEKALGTTLVYMATLFYRRVDNAKIYSCLEKTLTKFLEENDSGLISGHKAYLRGIAEITQRYALPEPSSSLSQSEQCFSEALQQYIRAEEKLYSVDSYRESCTIIQKSPVFSTAEEAWKHIAIRLPLSATNSLPQTQVRFMRIWADCSARQEEKPILPVSERPRATSCPPILKGEGGYRYSIRETYGHGYVR